MDLPRFGRHCSLPHDRSRDYYARKRSEGKQHNAAITCLARRRCDVIHAMLRSGLSYGQLPRPARPTPEPEDTAPVRSGDPEFPYVGRYVNTLTLGARLAVGQRQQRRRQLAALDPALDARQPDRQRLAALRK